MKFEMINKTVLIFLVLISVFSTSCNDTSKVVTDAIPSDANYVVRVDAKSLVSKSNYDIFSNTMIQQFVSLYKMSLKDEASIKLMDGFLSDANSLGVNLKDDLYFYTNYKVYGVVTAVNNANTVKEALISFGSILEHEITQHEGVYTYTKEPNVCMVWNDYKMLLIVDLAAAYGNVVNTENKIDLQSLAVAQLKQGISESINSVHSFVEFEKTKSDISLFFSTKGMDKSIQDWAGLVAATDELVPFKKVLEQLDGVSTGVYTSFDDGQLSFENKYFFDSSESEQKFKELLESVTGEIKGDHFKYIEGEPLALISTNVKGEGAYSYLEKLGIIELLNNELPEETSTLFGNALKDLNGDITIAITANSVKESLNDPFEDLGIATPDVAIFADVNKPSEIIAFVKEKMTTEGLPYTELSSTSFKMNRGDIDVYWGAKGNMLYFTNSTKVFNKIPLENLSNLYEPQLKGKSAIMFGNLENLQPFLSVLGNNMTVQALSPFLAEFQRYEFSTTKDLKGSGKLELATKDKNSLEVICKQFDQLISNFGGMFR